MTRSRVAGFLMVSAFAAATAAVANPQHDIVDGDRDKAALGRFHDAVADYISRARITEPVDLETLCLPENVVGSAPVLDVSPAPREGDIFAPEVADLFRRRIAAAVTHRSESTAPSIAVVVGTRLGAGRSAPLPKSLSAVLPLLPEDLSYRIAGRDLVILDLRANVVVDALRDWRRSDRVQ